MSSQNKRCNINIATTFFWQWQLFRIMAYRSGRWAYICLYSWDFYPFHTIPLYNLMPFCKLFLSWPLGYCGRVIAFVGDDLQLEKVVWMHMRPNIIVLQESKFAPYEWTEKNCVSHHALWDWLIYHGACISWLLAMWVSHLWFTP